MTLSILFSPVGSEADSIFRCDDSSVLTEHSCLFHVLSAIESSADVPLDKLRTDHGVCKQQRLKSRAQ